MSKSGHAGKMKSIKWFSVAYEDTFPSPRYMLTKVNFLLPIIGRHSEQGAEIDKNFFKTCPKSYVQT
jgi:hypothetical protein